VSLAAICQHGVETPAAVAAHAIGSIAFDAGDAERRTVGQHDHARARREVEPVARLEPAVFGRRVAARGQNHGREQRRRAADQ
jgi:hypothetical protein